MRGLTGAILLPFVHSSEADCQEAVSEEPALSRQLVSIHIKVPVGNNYMLLSCCKTVGHGIGKRKTSPRTTRASFPQQLGTRRQPRGGQRHQPELQWPWILCYQNCHCTQDRLPRGMARYQRGKLCSLPGNSGQECSTLPGSHVRRVS